MPERFRQVDLRTLKPSEKVRMPLELQQEYINMLREEPGFSYLLIGDGGTGKTTLSTALYRHALRDWAWRAFTTSNATPAVWRVTANQLVDEFHALSIGRPTEVIDAYGTITMECTVNPTVTQKKIEAAIAARHRPCLFLEELDKFNPSSFKANVVFNLVNQIYEARGQIVATSNKDSASLMAMLGPEHGETLLRRIGEEDNAMTLVFRRTR